MKHTIIFHFNDPNPLADTIEHVVEASSTEEAIVNIIKRKENFYVFESDDEIYSINLESIKYINAYETEDDAVTDRIIF
ncbi:hypothetical protein [Alkalicoccobacillus murimartini]|uniref:Uncharacterized protein n=1 Tax=Alkalicoccobacillus murimartini TaxID=171685 RepID=A0ABT9YLW6_9BACI|nr:hypothetical protein [Alkalicoccobacillus murimartini]MDQ0208863.1 hypothetical protein [Alkalicoccobacillus murimartini]